MTVKLKTKVVFCLCFGGAHTAVGCAGEKPEQDGSRNFFIFLGLQFSEQAVLLPPERGLELDYFRDK